MGKKKKGPARKGKEAKAIAARKAAERAATPDEVIELPKSLRDEVLKARFQARQIENAINQRIQGFLDAKEVGPRRFGIDAEAKVVSIFLTKEVVADEAEVVETEEKVETPIVDMKADVKEV